jgi:hypothetical protein
MARRRSRIFALLSLVLCWASAAKAAPGERGTRRSEVGCLGTPRVSTPSAAFASPGWDSGRPRPSTRPTRTWATSSTSIPGKCDARRSIPHCSRPAGFELFEKSSLNNPYGQPYRLRHLGDGYLLSAGELIWLPKAAGGRVWRFNGYLDPAAGPSQPRFDKDNASFGVPRVVGDRMFVAARGGGLYSFALPAIVGRTGDPQ